MMNRRFDRQRKAIGEKLGPNERLPGHYSDCCMFRVRWSDSDSDTPKFSSLFNTKVKVHFFFVDDATNGGNFRPPRVEPH